MSDPGSSEENAAPTSASKARRKRVRHQWGEASNPHDDTIRHFAWAIALLVIVVLVYLVVRLIQLPGG